jgi:hypothetical protein
VRDLVIALGEAFAQHVGVRRVQQLDREAVLGEQVLVLGCEDREIGQPGENHDFQWRLPLRNAQRCDHSRAGERSDQPRDRGFMPRPATSIVRMDRADCPVARAQGSRGLDQ